MREFFEAYKPNPQTKALIRTMSSIIEEYESAGYRLTLRQLYYQLVSRDVIPNTEKSYKRIGDILTSARMTGWIDWAAIEDRVRVPKAPPEFDSLEDLVKAAIASYRLPRLQGQSTYVELWVEKDALAGVLQPIAREYHVVLMVNRGYSSASAMKESADRIRAKCKRFGAQRAVILYLGDLDPSGEDMVRDVRDRLNLFCNSGVLIDFNPQGKLEAEEDRLSSARKPYLEITVEKLGLTIEQVEEHNPPPNPAKITDSRAAAFIEKYGEHSWEVDALPPQLLRSIIEARLDALIDEDLVEDIKEREREDIARLQASTETARHVREIDAAAAAQLTKRLATPKAHNAHHQQLRTERLAKATKRR